MRSAACCCGGGCCYGCYGWKRPRTKLRVPRTDLSPPWDSATYGRHRHGRGRGADAEVQLHGHHGQGRSDFRVSEAAGLPAQSRRLRLLPGHDQLVSVGM